MPTDTRSVDDLLQAGLDARAEGEVVVAEECFRKAMERAPRDFRAPQFLGALLVERDDIKDGVEILEGAVDLAGPLSTSNCGVYNNFANALRLAERHEESEALLLQIVEIAPGEWQHWHNLAHLLKDMGRHDEAVAPIRRAIALAPGHGPNHAVLGSILFNLGRLNSAAAAFRRCIDLGWNEDVNVWTQLGGTYRLLGDIHAAVDALQEAFDRSGGAASTHSNLGITMNQLGRFDDAGEHFRAAIRIQPDEPSWRTNYGYHQLTAGDIPEGWVNWEYGLDDGPRGNERPIDVPRWTPDDNAVRVLCYREQGVGDEILFASCLPDFQTRVQEAIYEADKRIVPLFARSFPGMEVREPSWDREFGQRMHDFDRAIPVGSLPMHLRPTVADFPERQSFLVPDPDLVTQWRATIAEIANGNAVVGMSWRSRIKTAERRLEYTHLDEWADLFSIPGVTWLNLQYDDCFRELDAAEREFGVKIHRWPAVDYMNDFDTVAAIMAACDLVVAPRNAVAMLSGALGRPTVMMGNRWDWSDLGTDRCPWLPTIDLVYRHVGEDWDQVLATAAEKVRAVASRKGNS